MSVTLDDLPSLTSEELKDVAERFARGELSFLCVGCARCCYAHPIGLTDLDVRRLAQYTHIDYARFKRKYTRPLLKPKRGYVYRFKHHNPCQFLDLETKRCRVYIARPAVCRTYPFNDVAEDGTLTLSSWCSVLPNYKRYLEGRL